MHPYGNNRRALLRNYGRDVISVVKDPGTFIVKARQKFFTSNSNMAPVTPSATPRKRGRSESRSDVSMLSKSRSRSLSRGRVLFSSSSGKSSSSTNVLASALRRKGKNVKKEGRKKKVKITKKFRKMVNQVLTAKGPVGVMIETVPDQVLRPLDNQQAIGVFSNRNFENVTGWKFSPTYIQYCYDKIYMKGAFPVSDQNLVTRSVEGFNDNLQVHVLEQYYVVKMKNNTARTMELRLWDISPKGTQDATSTYNVSAFITQTLNSTSNTGNQGTIPNQGRENPAGVTINTIGYTPKLSSAFNKHFTLDETFVKLEPGKEYYHKVKGPNDKLYKFNNFQKNGQRVDVMPFCKTTLVAMNVDLSATSLIGTNQVARWTDITSSQPFGLLSETHHFTKIKCPDQTGFQRLTSPPGAGSVQELSQVGYAFVIKNWYGSQAEIGTVVDIEDENPQNQATVGV